MEGGREGGKEEMKDEARKGKEAQHFTHCFSTEHSSGNAQQIDRVEWIEA